MTLLFIYLFIALFVSFLCSVLEAVLLSSTHSYIQSQSKDDQSRGLEILKELKANIDKPIAAILILNTFAHTMGAAGVGAEAQELFGDEWQTLIAISLTLIILYFSEIIPKTIGALYWKKLLVPSAYIIHFMVKLTYPLVIFSGYITQFMSKNKSKSSFSREELIALISVGEKEGALLSKESSLIDNLLKLKSKKAKDIMTPRSVVYGLEGDVLIKEVLEDERMYIHSRIPVYEESLDTIKGLVFNQTILEESIDGNGDKSVASICVPVFAVSENIPVPKLLDLFIKRKEHLFIVHDSYGQTAGVVTLEDAIETLLGVEIIDEMDEHDDMQVLAKTRSAQFKNKMRLKKGDGILINQE